MSKMCIFIVGALLVVVPFIIDCLYAKGLLSCLPHGFSGQDWFAFIGSYLPGIVFGMLSLHHSLLIRKQQKEIEKLKDQNRFRPNGEAILHSYSNTEKKVGNYNIARLHSLVRDGNPTARIDSEAAFLMEFRLLDDRMADLVSAKLKSVDWTIDGTVISQNKSAHTAVSLSRIAGGEYVIYVIWDFDLDDEQKLLVEQFRNNHSRNNAKFYRSSLQLILDMIISEEDSKNIIIRFRLEPQQIPYLMKATNQQFKVAIGEKDNGESRRKHRFSFRSDK